MQHHLVLKVAAKLLLPFILLFALYVQFHGEFGPGGGFQGGVIFGAGIILYELLAGEKPYKGRTSSGIIYQHIHADLPRLPDKLHRFQFLINRLLAKEPDHRFGSAGELLTGLRQASGLSNLKKS